MAMDHSDDHQQRIWREKNCYLISCSCHTFRIQQDIFYEAGTPLAAPSQWVSIARRIKMGNSCPEQVSSGAKLHVRGSPAAWPRLFSTGNSPSLFPFPGSVGIVCEGSAWLLLLLLSIILRSIPHNKPLELLILSWHLPLWDPNWHLKLIYKNAKNSSKEMCLANGHVSTPHQKSSRGHGTTT